MKKIALLHFAYPPNTGGVEILLREHAQILTDFGYEVTIFTGSGEEKNQKIRLNVIPELQSVMNFNPELQKKILEQGIIDQDFHQLSQMIEQRLETNLFSFDVIIVHNMLTIVRNLPFVQAFKNFAQNHPDKKLIAWTHDHSYINEFKIKDLKTAVNSDSEKQLLTTPITHVQYIAISNTFKKPLCQLMNLSEEEVKVIPNGINSKMFLEIDDRIKNIYQKFMLNQSYPLILSPVNILARKNLEYCIEMIHYLHQDFPKVLYLVTGQTSKHHSTENYLDQLRFMINRFNLENNVIFLGDNLKGSLNESELHDFYDLADVIVYLSESENFGLPILEAALSKTPIFLSNLDVFKEIIGNYAHYIDHKTTTPQKTAEIIKDFLKQDKRIQAHHHIRTNFDLKTILKEKLLPLL